MRWWVGPSQQPRLTPATDTSHSQAIECRFAEDAYLKLGEAAAVAASDGARARLEVVCKEIEEADAAKAGGLGLSSSVMLTLLRLSPDELGVRWVGWVAVVGWRAGLS